MWKILLGVCGLLVGACGGLVLVMACGLVELQVNPASYHGGGKFTETHAILLLVLTPIAFLTVGILCGALLDRRRKRKLQP